MADTTLLRGYDSGVLARFGAAVQTPAGGKPAYKLALAGLSQPATLGVSMPAEWFREFGMPSISITRGGVLPAPNRAMPAWRSVQPTPGNPNAVDIQRFAPVPVSIPYTVELVSDSMVDANIMTTHLLLAAMPSMGFGTFIVVDGQEYAFRSAGSKDLTDYTSKAGRVFRHSYDYVVEGWLFSTACDTVPLVGSIELTIETHRDSTNLAASPPPLATDADDVFTVEL